MSIYEMLARSETNVKFFKMLGRLQGEPKLKRLKNGDREIISRNALRKNKT